uniref:TOG domain-containing protein n=1 Tax=Globisporangium ultimum (strain ATCC 200006 / CBS 805.95 / DAOM BR144) TaxID=431595 RepID=K3WNJ0_GLOUD
MELSSGESALRTIKNRSKVPQKAVDLSEAVAVLLFPSDKPIASPSDEQHDHAHKHREDKDAAVNDEQRRALLEQHLTTLLLYGNERWEPLAVVFVVVRDVLATYLHLSDKEADTEKVFVSELSTIMGTFPFSDAFLKDVVAASVHKCMEHYEPRVRMTIAKLLGVLANWDLAWVHNEFMPQIVESVVCNLSRSPDFEENGFEDFDDNISVNGMETPPQSPESTPRTPSTPYRLDDVSGWKALESSLCAIKYIVKGSRASFLDTHDRQPDSFVYFTPELKELVTTKSCFHINRHVRVVGLDTITVLCEAAPVGFLDSHRSITDTLNKCIVRGLQDNWSQVRYAASIANRAFLLKLQKDTLSMYLPVLVPRLCLNRYYVAERVSKHSQETWRLVMGNRGRDVVAKYANEIVEYYVEMTNHSVREAACQCIGELGTKVDTNAIRPHVSALMQALIISLYDNSMLVRDAACLAAAQMVLGFPEECRPFLDELYHLWFDHLSDEVWSVREDAAIALGNAVRAYGQEALDRVTAIADDYLLLAKTQPAMSQQEYEAILKSEKKHVSQKAISCCAFDFKTNERHEHRTKEPWESSDGAIYLVRELCAVAPEVAVKFLPLVADIAILRHFPQTGVLQETVWKQVPLMCDALGKRVFKRYLELFFDPLVFTLQGSHRLARFAAKDCVASLSRQIGPSIFVGRLQVNPTWHEALAPIVASPYQ